jgi:cellulose biosynthesis protein BcsQ
MASGKAEVLNANEPHQGRGKMAEPIVNDFRAIHARMQQIRAERSSPPSRGRCATTDIDHNLIVEHAMGQGGVHDVTVVDTAGFENQTALFAMGTADIVLIPVMHDRNSVIEARKTARQSEGVARLSRRQIPYRVLLSRWNRRGMAERATLNDITASGLIPLRQHIPDLVEFAKSTFTGTMPHTGTIGRYAGVIIEELIELGAVPTKPERRAA